MNKLHTQSNSNDLSGLTYAFSLIILVVVFGSLSACSESKYPVDGPDLELPFLPLGCGGTVTKACAEIKTFKIPSAYIRMAYKHPSTSIMHSVGLEFAYPGLKPWRTIPNEERSNFQRIELTIRGVITLPVNASRLREFHGPDKPIRLQESLDGLESYVSADKEWNDYFPIDRSIFLRMHCAYSERPDSNSDLGCINKSYFTFKMPFYKKAMSIKYPDKNNMTETALWVEYTHKKMILPHWSETYFGLVEKIQSFEVTH